MADTPTLETIFGNLEEIYKVTRSVWRRIQDQVVEFGASKPIATIFNEKVNTREKKEI